MVARFAVPGIFVGGGAPSSSADRCTQIPSLNPPQAALGDLAQSRRATPGKICSFWNEMIIHDTEEKSN